MRKKTALSIIFGILFLVIMTTVRVIDVQSIGPEGTGVGFATLNQWFHNLVGVHMTLYNLTDLFGYLAIFVCVIFGCIGFYQLVTRRSLKKVDATILALGVLYIVTIALYVFFEMVVINYRPMIMPGELHVEASFPSSHTVLICVVMASALMILKQYCKNSGLCTLLQAACLLVLIVTVVGRLLCGAHWFTDIIAGIFASCALLFAFASILDKINKK